MHSPFATLEKAAFGRLLARGLGAAGKMITRNPLTSLAGGAAGYAAANSTPGQNLIDSMKGKVNAFGADAMKNLATTGAAVGAGLSAASRGDWGGAAQAAQQAADAKYNQMGQYVDQQRARADQGWNKGTGQLAGVANRIAQPLAVIGAGVKGFSEGGVDGMADAIKTQGIASRGMIEANDRQAATGQLQSFDPAAAVKTIGADNPVPAAKPAIAAAPANQPQAAPTAPAPAVQPQARDPRAAYGTSLGLGLKPQPMAGSMLTPSNAFLNKVMGGYSPNAKVDQPKADVIRRLYQQNGGKLTPNQVYADPEYRALDALRTRRKSAHITPFSTLGSDELQKEAIASGVAKGLGWVGKILGRSGNAAKELARNTAPITGKAKDAILDMRAMGEAAKGVGNKRLNMAGRFDAAAKAIRDSAKIQKAINYGGGAALAGAGLYGSNRMGYNSGTEDGVRSGLIQGVDAGMEAGLQSALASQAANQPGYLQGVWNGILGQPTGGISPGVAYGDMSKRRSMILNALMKSYAG